MTQTLVGTPDPDDSDWWKAVFTQHEYDGIVAAADDIIEEHETLQENPPTLMGFANVPHEHVKDVLDSVRAWLNMYPTSGPVWDAFHTFGESMCAAYMFDVDFPYVEELTDHAIWFGVIDSLMNDDTDDDDDDDEYDWIEEDDD